MVKIIFLAILLINIVFFFSQARKGAPEIYLPSNYENSIASTRGTQEIMLLSEVSELTSQNPPLIQPEESLPVNEMSDLAKEVPMNGR
ncbi:MAG: hypothetical protein KAJ63_04725 [Methyloprofundus sp.]|nr:hypothetical protein [Methyloprofundus sp.]